MEPEGHHLARLDDGALERVHEAVAKARRHAERVWEVIVRLDPQSEMVPWAQRETAHWDRLHALLKAERRRRRRASC